jgi:hypothetical protein
MAGSLSVVTTAVSSAEVAVVDSGVKLPLYLTKHYVVMTYGERIYRPTFS